MNYEKKAPPSTHRSNQSVYSHGRYLNSLNIFLHIFFNVSQIVRSSTNLASQKSRSMKSVRIPWFQKPLLKNNKYMDLQKGAMIAALVSLVSSFI